MARLGIALGWQHYLRGWHATCTAGAPAAAVAAGVALGLDAERLAVAMALAIPAAGGVQAAFGTDAKALQVGFAVDAGVRAADLAAAGATADPRALDQWAALLTGGPVTVDVPAAPAVPGGLAVKPFPCCYALQRPMQAARELRARLGGTVAAEVVVRTPRSAVTPLHHHAPRTGLAGKFSLEYGVAAALVDERIDFSTFEDEAVRRTGLPRVRAELTDGGDGLLDGSVVVEAGGERVERADVTVGEAERRAKAAMCGAPGSVDWASAAALV
jgi:2-methylcitrate dehydratase PrpD